MFGCAISPPFADRVEAMAAKLRSQMEESTEAELVYDHVYLPVDRAKVRMHWHHFMPHARLHSVCLQLMAGKALDMEGLANTLRARQLTDQTAVRTRHPSEKRILTVREYARVQTFPDQCVLCSFRACECAMRVCCVYLSVVEDVIADEVDIVLVWCVCLHYVCVCVCAHWRSWRFFGRVRAQYRMIGNAVPPFAASAFAREILIARGLRVPKTKERSATATTRRKRMKKCPAEGSDASYVVIYVSHRVAAVVSGCALCVLQ